MPRPINGQFRSLGVIVAVVISGSAIALETPGFARPKPPRPPVPTSPENAPPPPEPLNGGALNPRPSIFNEPTYNRLSGRRAELPPDRRGKRPGAARPGIDRPPAPEPRGVRRPGEPVPPPPGADRPPAPEPRGVRPPGEPVPPPPGVNRPPAPGEQPVPVPPPNTP